MKKTDHRSHHERWAYLRFSVVGQLLAAPPPKGELRAELERLAAREWQHPITGLAVRFGVSTLERWYHRVRKEGRDPVRVLRRKVRTDVGAQGSLSLAIREALRAQYAGHMSWSVALHHVNLQALAEQRPDLGAVPSYSTIRRFFKAQGLIKRRRLSARRTAGVERAEARLMQREVRSYEADHVGALWHVDAHHGSLKVVTPRAEWYQPVLIGIIDDRSRLLCHLQWYRSENAENVAHALLQALLRRGLPRSVLSDNGTAMCAEEITEGLARLGILHETTLAFSPYMNAKIETLWTTVEGQLMAMLESVADLTLEFLNEATQAWAEFGYNRGVHSETDQAPLARWAAGPDVLRPSPDGAALRLTFARTERRAQRRSDGTVVIDARRFEVPNAFRHLDRVLVRYARWDLSQVHLVDELSGQISARLYPLDKSANANGIRRPLEPVATRGAAESGAHVTPTTGIAPLLENLMRQQRATGLPPPYLFQPERPDNENEGENL
ncbi:MAG: DDE-type integrase/transposase/recombinase [Steroidobacteraceae bacterium]